MKRWSWIACGFLAGCSSTVDASGLQPDPGDGPGIEDSGAEDFDSGATVDAGKDSSAPTADASKDSNSPTADAGKDSGPTTVDAGKDGGPSTVDASKDSSTTTKPSALTVTGTFGTVKPIHILSSDQKQIISSLSIAPKPTFSPSPGWELPNVWGVTNVTISTPATNSGCTSLPSFTLNSSQVGMMLNTVDTLPSAACSNFIDDIAAKGITATLHNVPYPNGGSATVIIKLTP